MTEATTCPRRMAESGPWKQEEGIDSFAPDHGLVGQMTGCTFCGSISGDRFMELIRSGAELGPTDKSYKAYIGDGQAKFYYQHLSAEQRAEFIELHNAKRINIGRPGRLYVLPFFCIPASPEETS